jgi:hypothetical protein
MGDRVDKSPEAREAQKQEAVKQAKSRQRLYMIQDIMKARSNNG